MNTICFLRALHNFEFNLFIVMSKVAENRGMKMSALTKLATTNAQIDDNVANR